MTAAAVGIQLCPRLPNVEFTSFVTFVVGVLSGSVAGVMSGVAVMAINGFWSPWGVAGINLPFQAFGMALAGLVGGVYGRHMPNLGLKRFCMETSVLGASIALLFDLITNVGFALYCMASGTPAAAAVVVAFVNGIIFTTVHVASNTLIFGLFFIPLIKASSKYVAGGENTLVQ